MSSFEFNTLWQVLFIGHEKFSMFLWVILQYLIPSDSSGLLIFHYTVRPNLGSCLVTCTTIRTYGDYVSDYREKRQESQWIRTSREDWVPSITQRSWNVTSLSHTGFRSLCIFLRKWYLVYPSYLIDQFDYVTPSSGVEFVCFYKNSPSYKVPEAPMEESWSFPGQDYCPNRNLTCLTLLIKIGLFRCQTLWYDYDRNIIY